VLIRGGFFSTQIFEKNACCKKTELEYKARALNKLELLAKNQFA